VLVPSFLQHVRYAARRLRKNPGFTAVTVLTLGIGIGASAAIFSLIDTFWLRPMAVPHPQNIVRLFETTQQEPHGLFSWGEYDAIAHNSRSLESVVAIGRRGATIPRGDGTFEARDINVVSSNFFEALGVEPLLGRVFTSSDDRLIQNTPVVVLGHTFWQNHFNGDPHVVGQTITLVRGDNKVPAQIVGVLPPSFREVDNGNDRDIWMPPTTWSMTAGPKDLAKWDFRWFNLLARASSITDAPNEMSSIARSLELSHPDSNRAHSISVITDLRYRLQTAGSTGALLFAVVGLVVVLCVVNVANLLLARGLARGKDAAIRVALGGSRAQVFAQAFVENLLLALMALAAGFGIHYAIMANLPRLLARMITGPAMLGQDTVFSTAFHADGRLIAFACALTLIAFTALALIQISQLSRADVLQVVRSGGSSRSLGGRSPRFRRVLLSGQIAISLMLLIGTGILVRSFVNTQTAPLGITRGHVLVAFCTLPTTNGMPKAEEAMRQFRALPGVEQVAYAIRSPLMLSEGGMSLKLLVPGHTDPQEAPEIKYNAVSANYLAVTGTNIIAGRGLEAQDDVSGPPVVVINRTMARRYWKSEDPIGRTIHIVDRNLDARVVGIAEDAPINAIGELPEPYFYLPFRFQGWGEITFLVRSQHDAMRLAQPVRDLLVRLDPQFGPLMVTSMGELVQFFSSSYRVSAELVTALGLIGLLLTVVGLSAFLMYRVQQRTAEIGLRMALGSTRAEVTALIARDTLRATIIGALVGLPLALLGAHFAASALFGVRPWDPLSVFGALLALAIVTAITTVIPARRAASIDPITALHYE
jgi:putative ABC transport system permease protein